MSNEEEKYVLHRSCFMNGLRGGDSDQGGCYRILTELRDPDSRKPSMNGYSFVDPPPAVFNYSLSPNSLDQNKENLTPDPPTINVPLETDELRSPVLISPAPSSVFLDDDSQDSGYSGSQGSRKTSTCDETFLIPSGPPPPRGRQKSSLISRHRSEDDDGFMEEIVENQKENGDESSNFEQFTTLFQGTLFTDSPGAKPKYSCLEETPVKRKSGLESVIFVNGAGIKRPSVNDDQIYVGDMKRHKSVAEESVFTTLKVPKEVQIHRCRSESELNHAIQRVEDNSCLIGDFSNNHILPLITCPKIPDLKCIDGQTVCNVLNDRYSHLIDNFTIIDCRYPYEHESGHVRGALNFYTQESLDQTFLKPEILNCNEENCQKRTVLLFYCEYSKERGPKMSRFLRAQDRKRNEYRYPKLNYPEIYLLEGGYKAFYENYKEFCEPQDYKPMTHRDHVDDLRKFRIKSKSWSSFGAIDSSPWSSGEPSSTTASPAPVRRPGLNRGLFN